MAGLQEAARVAGAGAPRLMAAMTAAFAAGQIAGPLLVAGWSINAALLIACAIVAISAFALMKGSKAHDRTPAAA
jgi:hypothetical protein